MLPPLLFALEIKLVFKIQNKAWGIERILCCKTNKEALTVLCSVVKQLRSG